MHIIICSYVQCVHNMHGNRFPEFPAVPLNIPSLTTSTELFQPGNPKNRVANPRGGPSMAPPTDWEVQIGFHQAPPPHCSQSKTHNLNQFQRTSHGTSLLSVWRALQTLRLPSVWCHPLRGHSWHGQITDRDGQAVHTRGLWCVAEVRDQDWVGKDQAALMKLRPRLCTLCLNSEFPSVPLLQQNCFLPFTAKSAFFTAKYVEQLQPFVL